MPGDDLSALLTGNQGSKECKPFPWCPTHGSAAARAKRAAGGWNRKLCAIRTPQPIFVDAQHVLYLMRWEPTKGSAQLTWRYRVRAVVKVEGPSASPRAGMEIDLTRQ